MFPLDGIGEMTEIPFVAQLTIISAYKLLESLETKNLLWAIMTCYNCPLPMPSPNACLLSCHCSLQSHSEIDTCDAWTVQTTGKD